MPSTASIYEGGGITGVMVSTLGGRKVLVSFQNLEASLLLEDSTFNHNQIFACLEKWVPTSSISLRKVWLKCFGVPLHVWSKEN